MHHCIDKGGYSSTKLLYTIPFLNCGSQILSMYEACDIKENQQKMFGAIALKINEVITQKKKKKLFSTCMYYCYCILLLLFEHFNTDGPSIISKVFPYEQNSQNFWTPPPPPRFYEQNQHFCWLFDPLRLYVLFIRKKC